jgi:hypothetical protein
MHVASIPMNQETNKAGGRTAAEAAAQAQAAAKAENLTPRETDILANVLAAHPQLTTEEALEALRLSGM